MQFLVGDYVAYGLLMPLASEVIQMYSFRSDA